MFNGHIISVGKCEVRFHTIVITISVPTELIEQQSEWKKQRLENFLKSQDLHLFG